MLNVDLILDVSSIYLTLSHMRTHILIINIIHVCVYYA